MSGSASYRFKSLIIMENFRKMSTNTGPPPPIHKHQSPNTVPPTPNEVFAGNQIFGMGCNYKKIEKKVEHV
jgi:hypothetical protein